MVHKIKGCKDLIPYLKNEIEDEGIKVEIDSKLNVNQLAILKVDDYYRGLHLKSTPKAIDFLVVVDCTCDWFMLYLLELKNVKRPQFLNIREIHEKFKNTIEDFMSDRYGTIFLDDKFKYREIKLYLVSDAYGLRNNYKSYDQYKRIQERKQKIQKKDSLKVDYNLGLKLFKFRGKRVRIQYDIPPNPIIRKQS